MDPATMSLILTGASGIGSMLFGGDDEYKMSPEQRKFYNKLMREYKAGDFGLSREEMENMEKQLRESLMEESETAVGRNVSSLGRRGVLGQGSATSLATGIGSASAEAFGKGKTDISLYDKREGRRRKAELERALMGASQGDYVQGEDFSQGLGDMAGNWMQYALMKRKRKNNPAPFYGEGNVWG